MFLSKDHLCWLSYVAMSDHEHGDGELEGAPSATVATPVSYTHLRAHET